MSYDVLHELRNISFKRLYDGKQAIVNSPVGGVVFYTVPQFPCLLGVNDERVFAYKLIYADEEFDTSIGKSDWSHIRLTNGEMKNLMEISTFDMGELFQVRASREWLNLVQVMMSGCASRETIRTVHSIKMGDYILGDLIAL